MENGNVLRFTDIRKTSTYVVALIWTAFQLYCSFKGGVGVLALRGVHVAFAMSLVFLMKPLQDKEENIIFFTMDMLCALFMTYVAYYYWTENTRLSTRFVFVSKIETLDFVLGIIFIMLLFECCRRMLGYAMLTVTLVFVAYLLFGAGLPGIFGHLGIPFKKFVEMQFMDSYSVLGTAAGVSANTVFYFMLFGAFLAATPAGKLFIAIARYVTRKTDGGEGKTMLIACGLFGMISGSAAANVASVGTLTYDSMVEAKFDPIFSASTLAIAGSGGQLIPPVMGSAAFLMADYLGISYWTVCKYAIIPSLLYILSLYFVVHMEAKRLGIKAKHVETKDLLLQVRSHIYLLSPLIVLVVLIAMGRTVRYASVYATILLLILTSIKKETRMNLMEIIDTIVSGAESACVVAIPCAVAGVIVGVLTYTSLGLRLSSLIAAIAQTNLLAGLLLAMVLIIIMGMGMPTTAAYIMSATLLAGAFSHMGLELPVIHFFIFFFANLSMITPPVALASYTAAGLAKTPLWETGIQAFKYSFVVFLIPFCFIYNPALIGIGSITQIVRAAIPTIVGVFAFAMGIVGYFKYSINKQIRILLIVLGIMTIVPELITTVIGLVGITVIIAKQWLQYNKTNRSAVNAAS